MNDTFRKLSRTQLASLLAKIKEGKSNNNPDDPAKRVSDEKVEQMEQLLGAIGSYSEAVAKIQAHAASTGKGGE